MQSTLYGRSMFWSSLHDVALATLSAEWLSVADLRKRVPSLPLGVVAFDDLVTWGVAEVRRSPIVRHGIQHGETTSYRRCGE